MRLICFGDSNTYGYDPRSCFGGRYASGDRWPDLLAKITGWEVVNAGENGREIPHHRHTLRQAVELLTTYDPVDAFCVMLGTNDLLQGLTPEQVAGRMETFLCQLLPHCGNLILVVPPPMQLGTWVPAKDLATASVRLGEACKLLAERMNINLVSTAGWNIGLTFDGVHFTEAGHHAFAVRLSAVLQDIVDRDHEGCG